MKNIREHLSTDVFFAVKNPAATRYKPNYNKVFHISSVPDRNRTYDLQLRRLSLYPAELLRQIKNVRLIYYISILQIYQDIRVWKQHYCVFFQNKMTECLLNFML